MDAPPPDLASLNSSEKDALILARVDALVAEVAALTSENASRRARVAELEEKLGLPPKAPDNSSTPPSQGRKASEDAARASQKASRTPARISRCIQIPQPGAI